METRSPEYDIKLLHHEGLLPLAKEESHHLSGGNLITGSALMGQLTIHAK